VEFDSDANKQIELHYCDVTKDECRVTAGHFGGPVTVEFEEMVLTFSDGIYKVRRLGTISSTLEMAEKHTYSTVWIWYWKDASGKWNEYDLGKSAAAAAATVNGGLVMSSDIEEEFQRNAEALFQAPGTNLTFNLKSLNVRNLSNGTRSDIRRRPDRFNPETRKPRRASQKRAVGLQMQNAGSCVPESWSTVQYGTEEYVLVPIEKTGATAAEFSEIEKLFSETMTVPLKSVKRIQNPDLWEAFYRWREREERRPHRQGKSMEARQLFHGTRDKYVEAICRQGFDPRLSGMTVGTVYGKGCYFARDAKYSQRYTNNKQLLVVKVGLLSFLTRERRRMQVSSPPLSFLRIFLTRAKLRKSYNLFLAGPISNVLAFSAWT